LSKRRNELEDELSLEVVKRAATVFIQEQIDLALKERLPQLLRTGEARRPPQAAGGTTSDLGAHYLTRQQVSQITGYSLRTITRLVDSGKLRACGPRRDRITRFEVDRMMAMRDGEGEGDDDPTPDPEAADMAAEVDRLTGGK